MIQIYCNFNEAMNNQTEEDKSQQQLQHHKHDQQQLPQMLTESTQTQDGAINKLDGNLDDIAGECSGEPDQLSKREGNVSKNQSVLAPDLVEMMQFYCNVNEAMNNQTEEDKSQQQLQHHKHDQQQLPQMLTESTQTQDGAINKLDGNLDDIAGECSGESDQLSKREGNVSKNQFLAVGNIEQKPQTEQFHDHQARDQQGHSEHLQDGQTQRQQPSDKQKQDDQQLPQLQSSKPQMENEPIPPKCIPENQVITNQVRSGGKGENRGPNPEQNRPGHASCYQGHGDMHVKGGKSETVGRGKNEKPGRVKTGNDRPTSCDATYSDEEDEKTVEHPDFEFFWLKKSPFSQWYPKYFVVGDHEFVTAEQFMMYQKAVLFQDYETAQKILKERNPRKQQKLGRQAKNFNPEKWKEVCLEIVKTANLHKFSQNEDLKNHLFSTYPKILVEASPYDRIWGIGRAASDPKAQTKETWLGHNLLGYALTDVRNKMMIKENIIPAGAPTFLAETALIDIKNFNEVERFV